MAATTTDVVYSLRQENEMLKKQLHSKEDKTKKLNTKVQRLSEDLVRTKAGAGVKLVKGEFRSIEEAYSLVEELRNQVTELTRQNSVTRSKMQYFRTLHEAESRKRTPYDHIPPRVSTKPKVKKLYQSITISSKSSRSSSPVPQNPHNPPHADSDAEKLEDVIGMLRQKLSQTDANTDELRRECEKYKTECEKIQRDYDVQTSALKLEIQQAHNDKLDQVAAYDALDERFRACLEAQASALETTEQLTLDLKRERRHASDLEQQLKNTDTVIAENQELIQIIADLRGEKELLEHEQSKLLAAQFGRGREEEYYSEIETLRGSHKSHLKEIEGYIQENKKLFHEKEELRERLRELMHDKSESDVHMFNIQQQLDSLKEKMDFFTKNGSIDLSEIEEALSIVRIRKERGISLDFLMEAEELYADKAVLQELRIQHADIIHELEKVKKLLFLQERINKDYKAECSELTKKLEAMKNELRLEEDSRLLDARANKIAHLEGQLKSIVYGTAKIPAETQKADDEEIELATGFKILCVGQNMIEIHIEAALISDSGVALLRKLGIDKFDSTSFTTFVYFDFFEFETSCTPIGLGLKPVYNCTSRFKIFSDDFFLLHLQSRPTVLHFCVGDGTFHACVAKCPVLMNDLITDSKTQDRFRYYADLTSTHDDKTILGKIDFGLRVRLPMAQAIRAYKERTVALNLLSEVPKNLGSRCDANDLIIRIVQLFNIKKPKALSSPTNYVFAAFQFYVHEAMVTETVDIGTSSNPVANLIRIIPVPMTLDLDRYLRTSSLNINLISDEDIEYCYGTASVPLHCLAVGDKFIEELVLRDDFGVSNCRALISIEWANPYKLGVTPLISQMDRYEPSLDSGNDEGSDTKSTAESVTMSSDSASRKQNRRNIPVSSLEDIRETDEPTSRSESESSQSMASKQEKESIEYNSERLDNDKSDEQSSSSSINESFHSAHESEAESSVSRQSNSSKSRDVMKPRPPSSDGSKHSFVSEKSSEVRKSRKSNSDSGSEVPKESSKASSSIESIHSNSSYSRQISKSSSGDSLSHSRESLSSKHKNKSSITKTSSIEDIRTSRSGSKSSSESGDHCLELHIHEISFDIDLVPVYNLLSKIKSFFIAFEFLRYPSKDLETQSLKVDESGTVSVNYSKRFSFDPIRNERELYSLKRAIRSEEDGVIQFSIVSENANSECEDFAKGSLELRRCAKKNKFEIELRDLEDRLSVGWLVVSLTGTEIISDIMSDVSD